MIRWWRALVAWWRYWYCTQIEIMCTCGEFPGRPCPYELVHRLSTGHPCYVPRGDVWANTYGIGQFGDPWPDYKPDPDVWGVHPLYRAGAAERYLARFREVTGLSAAAHGPEPDDDPVE